MQCNKCNSDNTQRLEVVFENGTSAINTQSNTVGVGFGGRLGIGVATTKTSGTAQTTLGGKAAPPAKKPYKGTVISLLVGLVCLSDPSKFWLLGILLTGVGGYFLYAAITFNKNEWPRLYKYWKSVGSVISAELFTITHKLSNPEPCTNGRARCSILR